MYLKKETEGKNKVIVEEVAPYNLTFDVVTLN